MTTRRCAGGQRARIEAVGIDLDGFAEFGCEIRCELADVVDEIVADFAMNLRTALDPGELDAQRLQIVKIGAERREADDDGEEIVASEGRTVLEVDDLLLEFLREPLEVFEPQEGRVALDVVDALQDDVEPLAQQRRLADRRGGEVTRAQRLIDDRELVVRHHDEAVERGGIDVQDPDQ